MKGFGMIEAIIAAVLLGIIALVTATMLTQSRSTSFATNGANSCLSRATAVVNVFKASDNKLQIGNFHASAANPTPTPPYPHSERFMFPLANPTPGISMSSQYTNGWELINSGSNWAMALYNKVSIGVNFCSSPFTASPANQILPGIAPGGFTAWGPPNPLYPAGNPLNNEKIYLNIERDDLSTSVIDCSNQGRQRFVPLSPANNTAADPLLGNNIALRVTSHVQYNDNQGNLRECTASVTVKPDGDSFSPKFVAPPADILTGGICSPTNCGCTIDNICISNTAPGLYEAGSPPILCGNATVTVSAAASEPGLIFGCELDFSASKPSPTVPIPFFNSCSNFAFGGAVGQIVSIHSIADTTTGIKINLKGLTNLGFYTLFLQAFDSAQNPTVKYVQFQYKTTCP